MFIVGKFVFFNKMLLMWFEDWEMGIKVLLNKECFIGCGFIGIVYCVMFDDDLLIVIKKLEILGWIKNVDEFEFEMDYLGELKYINFVIL